MNIDVNKILKICDDFLQVPSVIEFEKPFLDYLNLKAKNLGYQTILKNNFLVVKKKINSQIESKYLFSAHIDRHGLILNDDKQIENCSFYFKKKYNLKFTRDTPDFYLSAAQRYTNVNISSFNEILGKIFNKFKTLRYNLDWKNKLVTFNLNKNLTSDDKIFMFNSNIILKDNLFFGQIDNVISVAVMFYILENFDFTDEMIFTTREEIGKSWECVDEYVRDYDKFNLKLVVLDTSPYENFNGKDKGFLVLREGDENGDFDLNMVEDMKLFLNSNKIPFYFKSKTNGMTELGRVSSESKGKINGITLQLPSLNYHTTYETSTIESLENYTKVILNLLEK